MSELEFNYRRLKYLMDKRGMSAGNLAKLTGLGRTTIHNFSTGVNKATSSRNLQLIADAMNTTIEYLQEEGEVDDGRVAMRLAEPIRQLAEIALRLSEVRQEELLTIAAALEKLEREQPVHMLSERAMEVMLDVAGEMGIRAESLAQLQELLKQQMPARFIDAEPPQLLGDQGK